ncbi:hypothetical protein RQM65_03015 [Pricia sp. S334]|uniref:DUF4595 domain-containing protein n=1 Tax=Pricia mediterranea TaxID=3076079 RepID=A0ABU3L1N8_9FLAO|nr:hypothetical protein [Pricia sp. S334]MDT7827636.1 hypothetical protein [Pricia sp. S334]
MGKPKYVLLASMALALGTSCEKSSSDEFEEVNGKTVEKRLSSIAFASAQDPEENEKVEFFYDVDKKLTRVSDGTGTSEFVYDDKGLTDVTGDSENDNFNIEELYKSPYDAFETGDVTAYDANGNPSEIIFFEKEYDYGTDNPIKKQYTAELAYEATPNVYFHTLKSAGLIEILDKVKLNFNMQPQAKEMLKAKALLPNNNLSKITYKNEEGEVEHEIDTIYTYDADDYPIQVTVKSMSSGVTKVFKIDYTYL